MNALLSVSLVAVLLCLVGAPVTATISPGYEFGSEATTYGMAYISGSPFDPAGSFTSLGSAASPHGVGNAQLVFANSTNKLYTFGGMSNVNRAMSGALLSFDTAQLSGSWTWLTGPSALQKHCVNFVCTFPSVGGYGDPPARYEHGMAYDPVRNLIWMFGGGDYVGLWGDLWYYNITDGGTTWRFMAGNTTLNGARATSGIPEPGARIGFGFFYLGDHLYLYGGAALDGTNLPVGLSDWWKYDIVAGLANPSAGSWALDSPVGSLVNNLASEPAYGSADSVYGDFATRHPGGRVGFGMVLDEEYDTVWLQAGLTITDTDPGWLNSFGTNPPRWQYGEEDLWAYRLSTKQWARRAGYGGAWGIWGSTWSTNTQRAWTSVVVNNPSCFGGGEFCSPGIGERIFLDGSITGTGANVRNMLYYGGSSTVFLYPDDWNPDVFQEPTYPWHPKHVGVSLLIANNFTGMAQDTSLESSPGNTIPWFYVPGGPACNEFGDCTHVQLQSSVAGHVSRNFTPPGAVGPAMAFDCIRQGVWSFGGCQQPPGTGYELDLPSNCSSYLLYFTAQPLACDSSPCASGRGNCTDIPGAYVCTCVPGFSGAECQTEIDECASQPCKNGGTCVDGVNSFHCQCVLGFTGTFCETDIHECASAPCENGGTCIDNTHSYTCQCVAGYSGTRCQTEINECGSNPCQNGGTCVDGVNSLSCICPPAIGGEFCQTLLFDSCMSPLLISNPSLNPIAIYRVHPQSGYARSYWTDGANGVTRYPTYCGGRILMYSSLSSGTNLQVYTPQGGSIINTFINGGTGCGQNPTTGGIQGLGCINSTSAYFLYSAPSSTKCLSILNLDTMAVSYVGSFTTVASFITMAFDPVNERLFCMTSARSVVELNIHTAASTTVGTMSNPCTGGAGVSGLSYNPLPNQFEMVAECGSGLDKTRAIFAVDPSVPSLLGVTQNITIEPPSSATFNGLAVSTNLTTTLCQNGGLCVSNWTDSDVVICSCLMGYSGSRCQTNIDECSSQPCKNGGTCVDGLSSYSCLCAAGFAGAHCETDLDECTSNPCKNSGTCVDGTNSFSCLCPHGFTGFLCESDVDECASNPCRNGGTCTDGTGSFVCNCPSGYAGSICETNVNECASHPCRHGGTCVDHTDSFSCLCRVGFVGTLCETNVNECASQPCENGGTCTDGAGSYTCHCPSPYSGTRCHTQHLSSSSSSSSTGLETSSTSFEPNKASNSRGLPAVWWFVVLQLSVIGCYFI